MSKVCVTVRSRRRIATLLDPVLAQLFHHRCELVCDLQAGLDRYLERRTTLQQLVQVILLFAEPIVELLRRNDLTILDSARHIECVLRRQNEHRRDIVHKLVVGAHERLIDARSVDAELQWGGRGWAFTGEEPRVAMQAFEDFL